MGLRDVRGVRRRPVVNFIAVLRAARELTEDPDFAPRSQAELAEAILERIGITQATALGEGFDWDALLDFVLAILPLILEIIMMFL